MKATREFITTKIFDKRWLEMDLSDENLRELEAFLLQNPSAGDMITGALYKMKGWFRNERQQCRI